MEATVSESTTSAVSAPTPTAAPATSAPSAPITPDQRPTFAEAFASDAAATTPSTPAEGTATTEPGVAGTVDSATARTGEPPQEKWPTILENARVKAREAALSEVQQKYAWTEGIDQATVETGAQIGRLYQQDRPGFIRQVLSEAMADPEMAPLIRSEAARALGSRQQQATAVDLSPDIPVMDGAGNVVAQTYSADRMKQIVQNAIQEFAGKELAPLQAEHKTRQQTEQARQQQVALDKSVQDIYSEAADVLPEFEAHKDEIAKVFATIPGDPAKALRAAWKQVVGLKLGRTDAVRAQQLTELQTKAAASGVNPASAVIAPTKRPTSFNDPSLKW